MHKDPGDNPAIIVSIVVPTCNRLERLRRTLDKIRQHTFIDHEIIVVDGASTDGTRSWLSGRTDVRTVFETRREGAVRAFNKGFRAARGEYVMWLNDDAWPLPAAIDAAVDMIRRPDLSDVGMVAFYHTWHSERNILHEVRREGRTYAICHVRGYPYANFGLLARKTLERVGFADEGYMFFGFDPDLALKIQLDLGLSVFGCPDALIVHEEHHDDRKIADLEQGRRDNERLFARWRLPEPGAYPDPRPAYERVAMQRGVLRPAHIPSAGKDMVQA